jgi:hypothetical protein
MLRSGRFRHRLLDDSFLKDQSAQAFKSLRPFFMRWKTGDLGDAEMAAVYVTVFSFLRRPQDFLGGTHNEFAVAQTLAAPPVALSCQSFIEILRATLPDSLAGCKSLKRFENAQNFLPFLCLHTLRSVPISVMRSLSSWHNKTYPLTLWTTIPSPEEVLQLQVGGQRCVSMFMQESEFPQLAQDGRDVFGFLIHDLIHADHFFHDPENAQAQIQFSRKLQLLWQETFIQERLQADPEFKDEFFYLMSDMNSVPLHLFKTLKAQLLAHTKRLANTAITAPLPDHLEPHFRALFEQAIQPWKFSSQGLEAAHRLNSLRYIHPEDSYLLHQELTSPAL